jgi:uncharacterized protein (DUF1697 family)
MIVNSWIDLITVGFTIACYWKESRSSPNIALSLRMKLSAAQNLFRLKPNSNVGQHKQNPMPRYVAFLRGVSPMNAKMPELKRCFEKAGFTEVRTLLSSGNVVFNARSASLATLARRAETAMQSELDRTFDTIIRSAKYLQTQIESDLFAEFNVPANTKRVITFLRSPAELKLKLPIERDGASILKLTESEVLAVYVPGPKGPVFMSLLERTFGKNITTRTLDTVRKCAWA